MEDGVAFSDRFWEGKIGRVKSSMCTGWERLRCETREQGWLLLPEVMGEATIDILEL